jgi:hypothetical protein
VLILTESSAESLKEELKEAPANWIKSMLEGKGHSEMAKQEIARQLEALPKDMLSNDQKVELAEWRRTNP